MECDHVEATRLNCDHLFSCACRRPGEPCESLPRPRSAEAEADAASLRPAPQWQAVTPGLPNVGTKLDAGKARLDLLPFRAVGAVGRVLAFGAAKYGPDNWRRLEDLKRRYTAAALRHVFAFALGERSDPESGEHHLAHAACCVLFVLEDALASEEGE